METNAKLINSIFTPTLTYQCQTWTLIKSLERAKSPPAKWSVCVGLSTKPGETGSEMRPEKVREMVGTTPIQHHIDRGLYVSGTWREWTPTAGTASIITIISLECQAIKQEDVHERPGSRASKTAGWGHTTSPLSQLSSDLADRKRHLPVAPPMVQAEVLRNK